MKQKVFIVMGLLVLLLASPLQAAAQSLKPELASAPQSMQISGNQAVVSFGDLGQRDHNLISPIDSANILFSTPPTWTLVEDSALEIEYDLLLSGADIDKIVDTNNPFGGTLLLRFNGQVIGSISLNETGSHKVRVPIPAAALNPRREDGRHALQILLDAQFSCIYDLRAHVVIKSTSLFDLKFETTSPALNLSQLPAPFYMESSFVPDSTVVVVPDNPETAELQAAMDIMAGFGSLIGQDYSVSLVSVGQLASMDLEEPNLIFVGRPGELSALSQVAFPLKASGGTIAGVPAEAQDDGIIQLAVSPWNENKVAMMVSGNTSEAVLKAGQAVSSGSILIFENPSVAYVADIQLLPDSLPVVEDFTFSDLGYATETLSGVGVTTQDIVFKVSKEQLATTDGYVDLVYYHSGLLDYGVSSLSVELNDQIVASAVFNEESEQVTTLQFKIPPGLLRFGDNTLRISTNMEISTSCDISGFSDPWLTISDQSRIHLPAAAAAEKSPLGPDLKFYPDLLTSQSDLGDVTFVVAKSDPVSWNVAAKLAYDLGRTANPRVPHIKVAYADDVPQDLRSATSLVVIGRPSTLPILQEFNDSLPAPFDFTNDTASERQMQIVYRVPTGVSVGYLEVMRSPFNDSRSVLVVSGNSEGGLKYAGDMLVNSVLSSQLAGTFAVTNGTQVATGNASSSLFSIVGTAVPGSEAIVTTPIPNFPQSDFVAKPPTWLTPSLVVSGVVVLIVLVIALRTSAARTRRSNGKYADEDTQPDKTREE